MIKHLGCQFVRIFALLALILCVLVSSVFYVLDRPLDYFEIQDTDQYIFEVAKGVISIKLVLTLQINILSIIQGY